MATVTIKELLESGVHYGHRTSKWNPRMEPYIYTKRNSIHIVDLRQTVRKLAAGCKFLRTICAAGQEVLFVATKRQAAKLVELEAKRCGSHFVVERWLGGMLTNFGTIRLRLERLLQLEELQRTGQMQQYSKKMISSLTREMGKIRRNLDGVRNMNSLPGALVVVDARREKIAGREARKLDIPVIALLDTDSDPDTVDVPIPGNDDAIRSIALIAGRLADAVLDGKNARGSMLEMTGKEAEEAPAAPEEPASEEPPSEAGAAAPAQ